MFAQQELLVHRLQPNPSGSPAPLDFPGALELLSTVVKTSSHSLATEMLLFQQDVDEGAAIDGGTSAVDAQSKCSGEFALPPNPLALLLSTVFP